MNLVFLSWRQAALFSFVVVLAFILATAFLFFTFR